MPYSEYKDLFLKAQKNENAPYKMFVFDLKNSKKMESNERFKQQVSMMNTMNLMTKLLLKHELAVGRKILLRDENVDLHTNQFKKRSGKHALYTYRYNPCVLRGDSYNFYVYKDSITEDEFLRIFYKCALKTNNIYTYHFASGNFETTDYVEGGKKYYIGYCVGELSENKENVKKDISATGYLTNNVSKTQNQ